MNSAGEDKDMNGENGESSRTNCEHNGDIAPHNPPHNDCGKHSDEIVNGALPKVKNLFCNIPNGTSAIHADDSGKVNNNIDLATDNTESGASSGCNTHTSTTLTTRLNGFNINGNSGLEPKNAVDSYLRNNVNCRSTVDKCPLKVRECSKVGPGNNVSGPALKNNGCDKLESLDSCQGGSGAARWDDDRDASSSDTGNEAEDGFSGDECCIYTYKGDQMADLPQSFFKLDAAGGEQQALAVGGREEVPENNDAHNSRSSSPEMDFLEMDFDPGPSCEQDSEEDSECGSLLDEEVEFLSDLHPQENVNIRTEEASNDLSTAPSRSNDFGNVSVGLPAPPLDTFNEERMEPARSAICPPLSLPYSRNTETNSGERTTRDVWGHHCSSGDLCSPGESSAVEDEVVWQNGLELVHEGVRMLQHGDDPRKSNLHSAQYHCIMAKRLVLNKHALFRDEDAAQHKHGSTLKPSVERTMIWSEREACVKQVTQISTSACGATAVINVLVAMNVSFVLDCVRDAVGTRLRSDAAPLPEYLFSRSVAGANHLDIIRGLEVGSEGAVYARFFRMYPRPPASLSLSCWLAYWMKKGAVPIATLNLQQGLAPGSLVPDAWHHQMIFGVGPEGVYLTNPLEFVNETTLWPQLASPAVLLVRRADVVDRWNPGTDLRPLMTQTDTRWKTLNVLGQVVNVIRESASTASQSQGRVVTPHVMIPAAYSSGITLAINRESPAYEELLSSPDLVERC